MTQLCAYHAEYPSGEATCHQTQDCVYRRLPKVAAILTPLGEVALVKRGHEGYWPAPGYSVDHFNNQMGVTDAQRSAMFHASMFGYDVPLADPDHKWNIEQPMGGPKDVH